MRQSVRLLLCFLIFVSLVLAYTACREPEIKILPVHQDDIPIQMLENGNYEVTKGYVLRHVTMMAEVKILKAKLEECRKGNN